MADFGLSRKISEASSNIKLLGVVPYIDPKSFDQRNLNNQNGNYKLNKKSDVYSVGVLMWQISSGRRPFYAEGVEYDIRLVLDILGGKRENFDNNTPNEYIALCKGKIINNNLIIVFQKKKYKIINFFCLFD